MKPYTSIAILTIIVVGFFIESCECLENYYGFSEKVSFWPENDKILIGDTLWFYSKINCEKMINTRTGDTVALCEIPELINGLGLQKFNIDSTQSGIAQGAISSFNFIGEIGELFTKEDTVYQYCKYEVKNNCYTVLIGIIPKKIGKYGIYVGDPPGVLLSESGHGCDNRGDFNFEITNADRHLEILYEFLDGKPISEAITVNYYCFEVVN